MGEERKNAKRKVQPKGGFKWEYLKSHHRFGEGARKNKKMIASHERGKHRKKVCKMSAFSFLVPPGKNFLVLPSSCKNVKNR